MSWQERAVASHRELRRQREELAEQVVADARRIAGHLGLRPDDLGDHGLNSWGDTVYLSLTGTATAPPWGECTAELRWPLDGNARALRLYVQHPDGAWPSGTNTMADCGPINDMADLAAALLNVRDPGAEPERSVGDLLYTVLQGLVREVVHDELDGRLGHGSP